jgi:hypothetical protein
MNCEGELATFVSLSLPEPTFISRRQRFIDELRDATYFTTYRLIKSSTSSEDISSGRLSDDPQARHCIDIS